MADGQVSHTFDLKKTDKILDRSEFVKLSKHGKKVQDHYFVVLFMTGISPCSRMGITVSRRVGNAVERNRLKRLIREWFRMNKSSAGKIYDVNIIAKKTAAGLTYRQVVESLEKLFDRLRGVRH